jgi:SAM-dependent methyltransferase
MSLHEAERRRILAENARREREVPAGRYALDRPGGLFLRQGQERALLWALREAGLLPLAGRRVLDVGCGRGAWLGMLERFGAAAADLAGIDLEPGRVAACGAAHPGAEVRAGDAAALPWPAASFDAVLQATVFTSILDPAMRAAVAAEMRRVLRPGGAILWYDFFRDNPGNPHVRGVRRRELAALFPGCALRARRVTLAPPLARALAPRSWTLATLLEALRALDTHLIAVLRPRP